MKRAFRIWPAAVLTVILCLCAAVTVKARGSEIIASGEHGTNITWELDSEGYLRFSGSGEMANTNGTKPWIQYKDRFGYVEIGQGITSICDSAFFQCDKLASVTIPDSVTSIGNGAFYECYNLSGVTIPDSVTRIGWNAFNGCAGMLSVTIPDSVTSLGGFAFCGCNCLMNIRLSENLTSIEDGTFMECYFLDTIGIPDGVTSIGANAFSTCIYLSNIVFPKSVTTVGEAAFRNCRSVSNVFFGGNITDWVAIEFGNEESNPIHKSGGRLFVGPDTDTRALVIPDGVTRIGSYAFAGLEEMTSVTIPGSVTSIGTGAFYGCSGLTSVVIPDGVDEIGNYMFEGCSCLQNITIGNGIRRIGKGAFRACESLGSIVIPDGVESIGEQAFYNCGSLATVNIPQSVTAIGEAAFDGCTQLAEIVYTGTRAQWGGMEIGTDNGEPDRPLIHCTDGDRYLFIGGMCGESVNWELNHEWHLTISGTGAMEDILLGGTTPWGRYKASIQTACVEEGVTHLGDLAFFKCTNLHSVTLPDSLESIGEDSFRYCTCLTSISIPSGVRSIGSFAFYSCSSLEGIVLPENLTEIGGYAFRYCDKIDDITIPAGVTRIRSWTFANCGLKSVVMAGNLERIEEWAFGGNVLTEVILPVSLKCIENHAFSGFTNMMSTFYTGSAEQWAAISIESGNENLTNAGVHYNYRITGSGRCGDGLRWRMDGDGRLTISGQGEMTDYTAGGAPWYNQRNGIQTAEIKNGASGIGACAFDGCTQMTGIMIPRSVKRIGKDAFSGCSALTEIHWGGTAEEWDALAIGSGNDVLAGANRHDSYSVIGSGTCGTGLTWKLDSEGVLAISGHGEMSSFSDYSDIPWYYNRSSIRSLVVGDGVTSISYYAFGACEYLTSAVIPGSVKRIGDQAFDYCSRLVSISIPDGVKRIGERTFNYCESLEEISLPESLTEIGDSAFCQCRKLTEINIPDGVTRIGEMAFDSCWEMKTVHMPKELKEIGLCAFRYCTKLESAVIPDGVTRIEQLVFAGCESIKSVTVPDGVTYIGQGAFNGCESLENIHIPAGLTFLGDYAFSDCSSLKGTITIPAGVTAIGEQAFMNCSSLEEITITNCSGMIGDKAFSGCSGLKGCFTVPDGVTGIGASAFSNCSNLTQIILPDSVSSIGERAFSWCRKITEFTIPEGVTAIPYAAFAGCESLTRIEVPDSIESIGNNAFQDCHSLKRIDLPAGISELSSNVFYKCISLRTVIIPAGVTYLPYGLFRQCSSLLRVVIPAGVSGMGNYAFDGCTALADIYFYGSEEQWAGISMEANCVIPYGAVIHYGYAGEPLPERAEWTLSKTEVYPGEPFEIHVQYTWHTLDEITLTVAQGGRKKQFSGAGNEISGTFTAADSVQPISIICTGIYTEDNEQQEVMPEEYDGPLKVKAGKKAPVPEITLTGGRAIETDGAVSFRITARKPDILEDYSDVRYEVAAARDSGDGITAIGDYPADGTEQTITMDQISETGFYIGSGLSFRLQVRAYGPGYESETDSTGLYVTGQRDRDFSIAIKDVWSDNAQLATNEAYTLKVKTPEGVERIEVLGSIDSWETFFLDGTNEVTLYGNQYEAREVPVVAYYYAMTGEVFYSNVLFVDFVDRPERPVIAELPQGLKEIGPEAFADSGIQYVIIPEGCERICDGAFAEAKKLTVIHIPASVTEIGAGAIPTGTVIVTPKNSPAEKWAEAQGYHVVNP